MPRKDALRRADGLLTPSQTPITERILPSLEESKRQVQTSFYFCFRVDSSGCALPVAAQTAGKRWAHARSLGGRTLISVRGALGRVFHQAHGIAATGRWDMSVLAIPNAPHFGVGQDLPQASFGDSKWQRGLVVGFWACMLLQIHLTVREQPQLCNLFLSQVAWYVFGRRIQPGESCTSKYMGPGGPA